jgi:hypothetical protein
MDSDVVETDEDTLTFEVADDARARCGSYRRASHNNRSLQLASLQLAAIASGKERWLRTVLLNVFAVIRQLTPCPLWVKSRHSSRFALRPLYPQKRTSLSAIPMSALCQKQTLARLTPFDHLFGAGKQRVLALQWRIR